MTLGGQKAKRRFWRPRFSLRSLTIIVTIACACFAAWEATKKYGCRQTAPLLLQRVDGKAMYVNRSDRSPLPLIVAIDVAEINATTSGYKSTYYVWLFGPMFKLPFESAPVNLRLPMSSK